MAVLSISDPRAELTGVAIGIDLGTTHSLVAVYHEGQLHVLPDATGNALLPSIVEYQGKTYRSIKRQMGRSQDTLPIEVSAEILKALYQRAEDFLKATPIVGAVITVPAYFDEAQRQATKHAAKLAGIKVIRLINEPTAAAIAYGLNRTHAEKSLVFDLGGGTFDVSLLSLKAGVFEVLATGGDTHLGGDDIDDLVVDWIVRQAPVNQTTQAAEFELLHIAKMAKEQISVDTEVSVTYQAWTGTLTRDIFNQLIEPLIENMLTCCERVLLDARLTRDQLSEMVLVGGATRIPYLQARAATWFGKTPHTELHPDQVVAMGAAMQADALTGNRAKQDLLLLDVTPLSFGLEMMSGTVEKMIMRNSKVPCSRSETFTTYQDNQTGLMLHVLQGERELVQDCRSLARFHLRGIPPMPAGKAKIKVTFQIDADGLLTVNAEEEISGCQTEVVIEATSGLSDEDVNALIKASIEHASQDMENKHFYEAQHERDHFMQVAKRIASLTGKHVEEVLKDA